MGLETLCGNYFADAFCDEEGQSLPDICIACYCETFNVYRALALAVSEQKRLQAMRKAIRANDGIS